MSRLRAAKARKADVLDEMAAILDKAGAENRDLSEEEQAQYSECEAEEKRLSAQIEKYEKIEAERIAIGDAVAGREDPSVPVSVRITRDEHEDAEGNFRPYKRLGDQLVDVAAASQPVPRVSEKLQKLMRAGEEKRAVSGLSEGVGADGGYLVQTDFSTELLTLAHETGLLINRVRKFPISANSNGLVINGVNETSRAAGSRWGGVQVYWENEADEATASKPKFRRIEFKAQKLIGLCYATGELLEDAVAIGPVIQQAFGEEFGFVFDDSIVRGNGAGKPLGILNCPALVTVSAESGQVATTLNALNVIKMRSRLWSRSRANSVWLINQDIEPELMQLRITGSKSDIPVYLPANGLAGQEFDTLFGRPVIPIEQCSTLGTVGDIMLVDLSAYGWIQKGGLDAQASMHVRFLYDEMAFRFIVRVDGKPLWQSYITPAQGSNTQSPFVALATRS